METRNYSAITQSLMRNDFQIWLQEHGETGLWGGSWTSLAAIQAWKGCGILVIRALKGQLEWAHTPLGGSSKVVAEIRRSNASDAY